MTLQELTMLDGVSGDEEAVRAAIWKEIAPYCDSVREDKAGNLIAFKKGKIPKKLMMCAHMDEVGFIVKGITEEGYLKFAAVGGIDGRILLGQRVRVGEKKVPGVIGIKAVHMTTPEERKTCVKIADMYMDIGAKDKEQAEQAVSLGDYAAFDSGYVAFGDHKIKAKALDDRVGCLALMQVLKEANCPYDLYAVFTVQEEVGVRGATVAAYQVQPDVGIVLEGTVCADTYEAPEHLHVTTLGKGPAFSLIERTSKSDKTLVDFLVQTAEKYNIPWQFKRTGAGGNEAGVLQQTGCGAQTAVISVPCRYIHSSVSVADERDIAAATRLAVKVAETIDEVREA